MTNAPTIFGISVGTVSAPVGIARPAAVRAVDRTTDPAPPRQVRVPALAFDESSITLVWDKPVRHADTVDYHVYLEGRLLGSANAATTSPAKPHLDAFYADPANSQQVKVVANTYTATGLRPGTSYRFTVRSVNSAGRESVDSAPVSQRTTPVPKVFKVTDYGAVGDGTTVNTRAIQAAIEAVTPGGKVLVPAGVFKSGAIWLKSDMTLEIAAGATLLGSADADDYPWNYLLYDYSTDKRFYALINAHTYDRGSLRNIRIVGAGTIDGNGWLQNGVDADGYPISAPSSSTTVSTNGVLARSEVARATALGSPAPYPTRSNLITLRGVHNAYYGGFTAVNPANHTLVNLESDNITVNGIKMLTYNENNADGIEFSHGDGLTVINNVFDTGDDAMNFAAGLGAAAANDRPTQHAWISDNYFHRGHGAVVAGSHTGAWIQDIVAEDNVIDGTDVALRMKTDPNNGGGGQRVLFRDNAVRAVTAQAFIFTSTYADANAAIAVEPAATKAHFTDVRMEHVTIDGTGKESISVIGAADQPHRSLMFSNVRFLHAKPASIQYLADSTFADVVFDNTPNPWVIKNSTGLRFAGNTTSTPVSIDASAGPTWPDVGALTATASGTSATLIWPAATDNTAVATYQLFANDRPVATVPSTALTATITGLGPALAYRFRITAIDATGNPTATGLTATATTTGSPDTTAPVPPDGADAVSVHAGSVGTTWLRLDWQRATDTYGVDHYDVSADGVRVASVPATVLSTVIGRLTPGTTYPLTVTAIDASGNAAPYRMWATATTQPPYDSAAPAWPERSVLRPTAVDRTSVTLTWTAATDDLAVAGYRVYVDGRPVGTNAPITPINDVRTTDATTYTVTGLVPGSSHTFTVQAGDAANKWTGSGPSLRLRTAH